ncbi:MAG: nickel-dependent hydrogenase large subunit [Corynebacterium sp.]|uniref:nickel-dependent hydrogenase large subunit n=1 Tax=Corynebacterium sp. TaxID=1720 RepID=UPI0026DB0211|nr:nickel-dependent hydrogenase large subunit [Corynebacterium sp.]MDO5030187.1 nickel-dependent hydrogenase large subunit [Corynebacterium sp.]
MSSESVPVTQNIQLDELVDPFEARLDVYRDDTGAITQVAFDLSGLPRIDGMLVGKSALDVPDITKRLCGLCPVVHHLAGVRAVENLYGLTEIPRTAQLIRELLTAGSTLDNLATKFVTTDREGARAMKLAGKALMRAAGSPSHFPDVAVPGGVRAPVDAQLADDARAALDALADTEIIQSAFELATDSAEDNSWSDTFDGLDVAAVDAAGELSPLGQYLAVRDHRSESEPAIFPANQWTDRVTETRLGDAAPRPIFAVSDTPGAKDELQVKAQFYRVGPVARQVIVGKHGVSPADAQRQLLADTVSWARRLLADPDLLGTTVCAPDARAAIENADFAGERSGVGIVDGPRGLLVHRYTAGCDGIVTDCQIMTPTAQNELWLTRMLTEQLCGAGSSESGGEAADASLEETAGIEESIWAADPCLPCSSAPKGLMTFTMREHDQKESAGSTEPADVHASGVQTSERTE